MPLGLSAYDGKVLGTYLVVSILHTLWDGLPVLTTVVLGPGLNIHIGQLFLGIGFSFSGGDGSVPSSH